MDELSDNFILSWLQVNFTVAVDFTMSNRPPSDPNSLHYLVRYNMGNSVPTSREVRTGNKNPGPGGLCIFSNFWFSKGPTGTYGRYRYLLYMIIGLYRYRYGIVSKSNSEFL